MAKDEEYSAFVAQRWPRLIRTALLLGCSREAAEDLVQEALVKCYLHWGKVSRADDRDAYVHRLLVNTHRTALRRRWHQEVATEHSPETAMADPNDSVALAQTVTTALARLNPMHREAVVLRHYAGLSEAQTAQALKVPAGTVKSRLSRAVAQMAADPDLLGLKEYS